MKNGCLNAPIDALLTHISGLQCVPIIYICMYSKGAWLFERPRRWSSKPDVAGSIPVTTEFFLILCDSNLAPKWFGIHYNLEVQL